MWVAQAFLMEKFLQRFCDTMTRAVTQLEGKSAIRPRTLMRYAVVTLKFG